MRKFLKFGCLGIILLFIIIVIIAITSSNDDNKTEDKSSTPKEESKTEESISWEEKVKDIISAGGTKTEKSDSVSLYASDYKPTNAELSSFEDDIINEYKSKKYIKDSTNQEYMLSNIFKAAVIENYYADSEQKPIDFFAFDFLQNSKYVYRGVETATSQSTILNEEQMEKALDQMEK